MSLPPAPQDISEQPHAGSVTVPTDKHAQDTDVDRKIRLYGVIQALRQGRLPDNAQIDKALSYLRDASPVNVAKLSPEGKKLVADCRNIIETARLIVKRKNSDELFQNFVWHTRDLDMESTRAAAGEASQVDPSKLTEDTRLAMRHLRTLLSLILTNSEVRKLLSDFSVIGRDILEKGASKAAEALRPPEQTISHADQLASPDKVATTSGQDKHTRGTPMSEHEAATGGPVPEGKQAVQKSLVDGGHEPTSVPVQKNSQKKKFIDPQGTASVSSNHSTVEIGGKKHEFKEHFRDVKDSLTEEYFPADRRDQFIYRGKKVIVELQKHDDYRDAIKWLLSIGEEYLEFGESAGEKGKEGASKLLNDPHLRQTGSELRQLLERFANGKSMHLIFDSIGAVDDDARRDEEFRAWLQRLSVFIRRLLLENGYVLEDDCSREGNEIRESGRKFWDDKYLAHFDNIFNSIGDWFSAMGDDPSNKQFGDAWARLTRDLLFDSKGNLQFKSGLWLDIRTVIVPTLVDQVGYIPIPRIEYSDTALDLVLENLTLQGRNLLPNIITLVAHNHLKFSPYSNISDEHHHEFIFTLAQIQADMRDVAFFFHKKTGFPKVTDSGMADVVIGGSGLTAVVHLVSAGEDRTSVFKVKDVHVRVSSLKFSIRDSKHDLLYKTLKPLATRLVKRQIKKAIADAIRTGMEYVDGQLVSVRDRMAEARSSDEINQTQVLQELFKRHKEEHSVRESDSKSAQFKVVSSKHSSMIDTGRPSGWVSRVSQSEEKAITGREWRSEAFTIV